MCVKHFWIKKKKKRDKFGGSAGSRPVMYTQNKIENWGRGWLFPAIVFSSLSFSRFARCGCNRGRLEPCLVGYSFKIISAGEKHEFCALALSTAGRSSASIDCGGKYHHCGMYVRKHGKLSEILANSF